MSSITIWNRLEPRARNEAFDESLAARVHDPLWFLTRQWQLKEFEGEDGGSAVAAQLQGVAAPLTRVRLGLEGTVRPLDGQTPLEAIVEREPARSRSATVREAAEAGLMWLQMLDEADLTADYRDAYRQHLTLASEDLEADQGDLASIHFRRVLGGRVPDGAALYAEFEAALRPDGGGSGSLPVLPVINQGDQEPVETLARAWLEMWDQFASEPPDDETAWRPSKLEYQFSVAAPLDETEVVLVAEEYPGGHLDWYAFRIEGDASSLGAAEDGERVRQIERQVTPAAVEIPGNPTDRFWEFEDGRVDLARLEAAPEELARMLVTEFALIYGNDWLFVPVDLPSGTVFRIDSLEMTDTFGETVAIEPATATDTAGERWGFFHLSEVRGATVEQRQPAPIFVLPPVLAASLNGTAVEEVVFMRDEMANLAWAVEKGIASNRGRMIDRNERYQRKMAALPSVLLPDADADIRYRMLGRVPDYWIPLMPVRTPGEARSIRLQRGSVRDPKTGVPVRPLGRILVPEQPLFIDEEDVPRTGLRVTLAYQHARWSDGSCHLWLARHKRSGRDAGSSGVSFDQIE